MVKIILKISCLSMLFSCSKSEYNQEAEAEKINEEYQYNYTTLNVKGNVKSIVCTNYKQFIPDSLLGYLVTKEDFVFNKQGNIIEEKHYLEDEELQWRRVYEYDKMNNQTQFEQYGSDSKKTASVTYFYNKQGKLLRIRDETVGGSTTEVIYKYMELRDDYDKCYSYRRILPNSEQKDGNYVICTFSKGKRLSYTSFNEKNEVVYQRVEKYNSMNKIVARGSYQDNDTTKFIANETWVYDDNGKLIREQWSGNERTYDQNENIINQIAGENSTFNSVYVYDKKNNWIKRTTYLPNGKLRTILERKIEYFD
jgi:hypothetical protein